MDSETCSENPYASSTTEDADPPTVDLQRPGSRLGLASLLCALVFPVVMYGGVLADACGILGPAPPGAKTAVALLFAISSLSAVVLAVWSFSWGVRVTSLIGLTVGAVELLMCLGFAS